MRPEVEFNQLDQLCRTYENVFPEIVQSWWFMELSNCYGWQGTIVDGAPVYFVVAKRILAYETVRPDVSPDVMARALIQRAAMRIGWKPTTKAPQVLGLCSSSIRLTHTIVASRGLLELTGGLGFRVV